MPLEIRKTAFGFPAQKPQKQQTQAVVFQPTGGVNAGVLEQSLQPGYTPAAKNWVVEDGWLKPRSGLSQFADFSFGSPVLGAAEIPDASGRMAEVAASATSVAFFHPEHADTEWRNLAYVGSDPPSGVSTDYWSIAPIYDPTIDQFLTVLSNGTNSIKFFPIRSSTTNYSDFTVVQGLDDTFTAASVFAINDRLCFFNTQNSNRSKFPTRVLWSNRGNPRNFLINEGAGFEDIMGMKGEGQTAVKFRDVILLFTEIEIWIAQPTLDDYAFRFHRLSDHLGCPFINTVVATPAGVIFMASDFEVYLTDGSSMEPLGRAPQDPRAVTGGVSRIQKLLKKALSPRNYVKNRGRPWALYNSRKMRYELYYPSLDAVEGFSNQALYFDFGSNSWLPEEFSQELSLGLDMQDGGRTFTWNDFQNLTWAQVEGPWEDLGAGTNERQAAVFSVDGLTYKFREDQGRDGADPIDCRWRSHALNQRDQTRNVHLSELFFSYIADNNSSLTVALSSDFGRSFPQELAVGLPAEEQQAFLPTWITGQSPQFEIRADGETPVRIGRLQASLVDGGRRL